MTHMLLCVAFTCKFIGAPSVKGLLWKTSHQTGTSSVLTYSEYVTVFKH